MNTLSLADLLAAEATPWHKAADTWQRLADSIDNAAETMFRGTRDLPHIWPSGTASAVARDRARQLCAEISNAYPPARRIGEALQHHAYAVAALREHARQIVAEARQAGFTVDVDTGTITAPATAYQGATLQHTSRAIAVHLNELREVLDRAQILDAQTTNLIRSNLPDQRSGFGTIELRPLGEADLRAQAARSPAQVFAWWRTLNPQQQEQAIRDYPDLVGWLDGVPATDRDTANRIVLHRDTVAIDQTLTEITDRVRYLQDMLSLGRAIEIYPGSPDPVTAAQVELEHLGEQQQQLQGDVRGLRVIADRLADPKLPSAHLLGISTHDDGKAIVAIGDPDQAANVLTYVPGTGSDLSKVNSDIVRADRMYTDAALAAASPSTSSVFWLGYDAPDTIPQAGSSSFATNGATDLDRFQAGLRATHDGDIPPRNTVLGHSYGSTVIGHAAQNTGFSADAVIFVGSPGVDVNHASDLVGIDPDNVYATRAQHDLIARIPDWDIIHGNDPTRDDFGARVFASDPGNPDNEGATHSQYWDPDNIARKNIARIVIGNTGAVR